MANAEDNCDFIINIILDLLSLFRCIIREICIFCSQLISINLSVFKTSNILNKLCNNGISIIHKLLFVFKYVIFCIICSNTLGCINFSKNNRFFLCLKICVLIFLKSKVLKY